MNLDPGIADIVQDLNRAGFKTSDSGDGVSKAPYEPGDGQIPFPHVVVIPSTRSALIAEADRLWIYFLCANCRLGVPTIEATYNPAEDGPSVLLVYWAAP